MGENKTKQSLKEIEKEYLEIEKRMNSTDKERTNVLSDFFEDLYQVYLKYQDKLENTDAEKLDEYFMYLEKQNEKVYNNYRGMFG